MSMDKVQLKQESVLNDDIVLSDINPITNTDSITDSATGDALSDTFTRVWNAINNKLTRVVNSVNGRTGVVVLSAEDVGLGDVDNVSYTEIKQWVLNQLAEAFSKRTIRLYPYMDSVYEVCATNDKSYDKVPFYCEKKDSNDERAYIGYYFWNATDSLLEYEARPINTVGYADNSIAYMSNDADNLYDPNNRWGLPLGGIGVNIHPDEEALYIHNGDSKTNSGLRIDPSKLSGGIRFSDAMYQSSQADTVSLLAGYTQTKGAAVSIYINDVQIESTKGFFLNKSLATPLTNNTIIVTNFAWQANSDTSAVKDAVLMARQPAIGYVTSAPSTAHPETPYVIKFYSIKPYSDQAFGIKLYQSHNDTGYHDSMLGIKLAEHTDGNNVSGLMAYSNQPSINDPAHKTSSGIISGQWSSVVVPWESGVGLQGNYNGGLSIKTDWTIAVLPLRQTYPYSETGQCGCREVINWQDPMSMYASTHTDNPFSNYTPENGYASNPSVISVNMNKLMTGIDQGGVDGVNAWNPPFKFINTSGIKIVQPNIGYNELNTGFIDELGILDGMDATGNPVSIIKKYWRHGGGIQVNVGKFLEICPKNTVHATDYDDSGKVQVRIGDGLKEHITYTQVTEDPGNKWPNNNYVVRKASYDRDEYDPVPSVFTALGEKPEVWPYGFINYYQEAILGWYHEDSFYEDSACTIEIIPDEHMIYLDHFDFNAGKFRAYCYDSSSSQYVPIGSADRYFSQYPEYETDLLTHKYYVKVYSTSDFVCPDFDNGTAYYTKNKAEYADVVSNNYLVYLKTESNRITLNIDEDSGLYLDDRGRLSYAIPTYTSGHSYHAGQLIRHNGTSVYLVHTSFDATEWHVEPGPGDESKCTLISNS